MKHVVGAMLVAALGASGCTLIFDPDDHLGAPNDAGRGDAGRGDAGMADPGRDAAMHADAGRPIDSGPPPPECTSAADCGGGGLVQCVDRRCVFCAAPSRPPHELRSGANLRPQLELEVRTRATEGPLGIAASLGTTNATPSLVHAFALDDPSTGFSLPIEPAVRSVCGDQEAMATSVSFSADGSEQAGNTRMQVLSQGPNGSRNTYLIWDGTAQVDLRSAGNICRTARAYPQGAPPGTILPMGALVSMPGMRLRFGVHRERASDGTIYLVRTDDNYADEPGGVSPNGTPNGRVSAGPGEPAFPGDDVYRVRAAGRFAYFSDPGSADVVLWNAVESAAPSMRIATGGRTGHASIAPLTADTYLIAFPVGDRVRFVTIGCTGYCRATGQSSDLQTEAASVAHVSLGLVNDVPVVLTGEQMSDGTAQLVLRVLRPTRASYDAPGGGRGLVIATLPSIDRLRAMELRVFTGSTSRYVAAWMAGDASASSVVTQAFTGTCPP